MKQLFTCALFLLPSLCFAQYSFKDLSGKWVEQTRTDKRNEVVPFKDTLYIEIREDGFMMVRHTIGATVFGNATLNELEISIEKEKFSIETVSNTMLKLKQDKKTHRFSKQEEFRDAPVIKVIPGIETGNVAADLNQLNGKWFCYKKTDTEFDKSKMYIKQLEIYDHLLNSMNSKITFQNMDSVYTSDMKIELKDMKMILQGEGQLIKLNMLKSDENEMILQNGSVSYFLKRVSNK